MDKIPCKLTDQNIRTHNGFQWTVGKWEATSGEGELCGRGWLHYYEHPLLAILHNPIHASIANPLLWRVDVGEVVKRDGYKKAGATKLRLIEALKWPPISIIQRIAYGILCAKEVCDDHSWNNWADKWLSGVDRSYSAAWSAWSLDAAWNSTLAAESAAREAALSAAESAEAAAEAREVVGLAAEAALCAASMADLHLIAIAKRAMEVK
jgi:hypothetical protein